MMEIIMGKVLEKFCKDCDELSAEFFIEFDKWFRKEYHLSKKYPVCVSCLFNILDDGMLGGGGPTHYDVKKIARIDKTNRWGK